MAGLFVYKRLQILTNGNKRLLCGYFNVLPSILRCRKNIIIHFKTLSYEQFTQQSATDWKPGQRG
jgi:hypothetical protein